ncbi:MAG: exo-alpha-sialidase [Rhodospirillaceae bacterium]|nr:exo-alpha-sialidase [Rhodospirillaceae bacterium]
MVAVVDVSPVRARTTFTFDRHHQSVSGKALCVAMSRDGQRLYLGGHSGVWRSDDGGQTWTHPERPQPHPLTTNVPGALLPPAVYDLLISPANPDIVLAATGRDSRQPAQNGIWRSTDGAHSWRRVHKFAAADGRLGTVGAITVAPDDPRLMFAGGQFAIGISTDGGETWSERTPQTQPNEAVFYVVSAGRLSGGARHVYAVGTRVWHSADGGQSWTTDPVALNAGSPADGLGFSARCLCVDPSNSRRVYLARAAGELWRGELPSGGSGPMTWTQLPAPPMNYGGTTASGTDFILVHRAPDRSRQFIFSDRRTVHAVIEEPASQSAWTRIDPSPVHVDPHGIAVTADFAWAGGDTPSGRIVLVNDGGAVVSNNGAASWDFGAGLSTLGLVNTAVLPRRDKPPALVIQMGDNNGFFSADGGRNWRTQDYRGGDNDCSFADPRQPERLIVFAPRHGARAIFLYTAKKGEVPDGSWGTDDRQIIPSPPPPPGETKGRWNAVSNFYNLGYRPLILTRDNEPPRAGGDFVTIVVSDDGASSRLLRTTRMSQITAPTDWNSTATDDGPGVKVFQQGPTLPSPMIGVVQPSGGHSNPTFYVGDQAEDESQRVWRWRRGQRGWREIVPAAIGPGPTRARRFFVDPYRPTIVYVLGTDHVWRSLDGGSEWSIDQPLENALTESGAFPVGLTAEAGSAQVLLRDMVFDPSDPGWRVAIGPAGVFLTLDGTNWRHILLSSAAGMRPNNAVYDRVSTPCARMLYVSTSNRGVLRLGPLPPDWGAMPGGVNATIGKLTMLRVHNVGTKFGPPDDQMDVEVVIRLDSEPGRSFGFQLRKNAEGEANEGMLALLRDAFDRDKRVRVEFIRTGCASGRIIRVILES